MKLIRLLFISIILLNFSFQNGNAQGISPKNDPIYSEFIDSVPELKVPLEFHCGIEKLILTNDQREMIKPFTPSGFEIIGKLSINPKFNLIICGELVGEKYIPYLFVTNNEGLGNSYQKLIEDTCTNDSITKVKYILNVISQNSISISQIKYTKTDQQETLLIYEINKEGEIKRKIEK